MTNSRSKNFETFSRLPNSKARPRSHTQSTKAINSSGHEATVVRSLRIGGHHVLPARKKNCKLNEGKIHLARICFICGFSAGSKCEKDYRNCFSATFAFEPSAHCHSKTTAFTNDDFSTRASSIFPDGTTMRTGVKRRAQTCRFLISLPVN